MKEGKMLKDLSWRKENADLGTLTTDLGRRLKNAHSALGKLDISDFHETIEVYSSRSFSDIAPADIARLGETAEGIDSVVDSYLAIEEEVGRGYLPNGAAKVKKIKQCMQAYVSLVETVLAESYAHFVDDSMVFEKSLKKNNLAEIEESRALLGRTLAMYQEISKQAKKRNIPGKKKLDKKIRKYAANFARVDALSAEILDIMHKFSGTEWGENNEKQLQKIQNRFYRRWFFRKGIISKCEDERYPEGAALSEALCGDIEYVLANLQDVSEIRKSIKRGILRLNAYAKEIAGTGASQTGIERIREIAGSADSVKYQSIQDNFYFSGLVDRYAVSCEKLVDYAGERLRQINSECTEQFLALEKSGAEDMELEHLQRCFDELGNHELSGRVTLLRRKQNQASDFFSMVNYLGQQECPPNYLMLQETLLGRNGERDWGDRLAAFGCMIDDINCNSDEQRAWLKHARYAIHEDSVRGYLRQKSAGSAHVKSIVDFALAAVDIKLNAS